MSIFLRPSLSPKWPKTTPPTGRAAKPTQKVAKAANWAASGESFGEKNRGPKTKAAAVPYRKKSYHSMDVPIKLAIATRAIGDFLVDSWVSLMITSYHDSHGGCRVLQLQQMYVARKIEILHRQLWLTECTRKETTLNGVLARGSPRQHPHWPPELARWRSRPGSSLGCP